VTPITLGLTLLAGGIAVAVWPAHTAAQTAALLLGVVGIGLVIGSFLQGGRGLILVAIPLALITWVLQAVPVSGFGNRDWRPVTTAQVQRHYALTLGNGRLDLTGLPVKRDETVRTSVAVGVGETHVILPPTVDAQVSCQTLIGGVNCLGDTGNGHPSQATVTGAGKIILDVHSLIGQVHVKRGS
jgi:hypothetical protein